MVKTALLIIDPQNDFTCSEGSLYIKNSEKQVKNIADWIADNTPDDIFVTMDTHFPTHIGCPSAWIDTKTGNYVSPFTKITEEDIKLGKYAPTKVSKKYAISYLEAVKEHTIWPEHCIAGSWGACINNNLLESLKKWSVKTNHHYTLIQKGRNDRAEMYSVFSDALGEIPDVSSDLMKKLENFDKVVVCGFAKDYCVAESVKDLTRNPKMTGKLKFFMDGMACIDNNNPSLSIYDWAVNMFGATVII